MTISGTGSPACSHSLHRRHGYQECLRFLKKIDKNVPAGLEVHLVCDNYGTHQTPQIQAWLQRHPRFRMHFTRPARRGSTRPGAGSAS